MGSSLQFGVLREGSSITLMGEYRVTVDEDVLEELRSVLQRIEARTGEELDTYGQACFPGIGVARYAQSSGKSVSYLGL